MPPTRGHDLKLPMSISFPLAAEDAPHTGARLETYSQALLNGGGERCPPHGGTT